MTLSYSSKISNNNLDSISDTLESLRGQGNQYKNNQWRFKGATNTTINFDDLLKLLLPITTLNTEDRKSLVDIAKILFINSCKGKSNVGLYKQVFDCILKTLYYLQITKTRVIKKHHLQEYLKFILINEVNDGVISQRVTPLSYNPFSNGLQISIWYQTLKHHNIDNFIFTKYFSDRLITSELKTVIYEISNGDLTYRDWRDGGNFNKLTLDYGRYYIEHCIDFFNSNIGYAISIKKTLSEAREILFKSGVNPSNKDLYSQYLPIVSNYLSGVTYLNLPITYKNKSTESTLKSMYTNTLITFNKHRNTFLLRSAINSKDVIFKILEGLNLDENNHYELIKLYARSWFDINHLPLHSTSETQKFDTLLGKLKDSGINISSLNVILSLRLKSLQSTLPAHDMNKSFYESIGLGLATNRKANCSYDLIGKAFEFGVASITALTGWRSSEFTFSLSDITFLPNRDILDQTLHPIRFNVNSTVPKTNGETKLNREITDTCYNFYYLLTLLRNCDDFNSPICPNPDAKSNTIDSSAPVKRSLLRTWTHFINNYKPFKDIDHDLDVSSSTSMVITNKRLSTYENQDPNLINAYKTFRSELPTVDFFFNTKDKRKAIFEYSQGGLDENTTAIFDDSLSIDLKHAVMEIKNINEITTQFVRSFSSNLVSNCLYPTPHSLRHIWAESVYRRFDGDVGWMIRSTFKHISQNMWLAYVRNKDNLRQHDQVKRKVISSILSNYLLKSGNGYSGHLDKLLRRLFIQTKTTSLQDIKKFSTEEIISVKSNPWGFCLLKKRNVQSAKCFDDGAPQRQNASPNLCLGCSNHLAQDSNIEGILLNIANDINTLKIPNIPAQFLSSSTKTVKNALIMLKKLDADEECIDQITSILNSTK